MFNQSKYTLWYYGIIKRARFDDRKMKLKLKSEETGAKYIIESPDGDSFRPNNFAKFCRERGLSHTVIKQCFHFGKGDKRVQRGPSKGWRILEQIV